MKGLATNAEPEETFACFCWPEVAWLDLQVFGWDRVFMHDHHIEIMWWLLAMPCVDKEADVLVAQLFSRPRAESMVSYHDFVYSSLDIVRVLHRCGAQETHAFMVARPLKDQGWGSIRWLTVKKFVSHDLIKCSPKVPCWGSSGCPLSGPLEEP